MLESGHFSCTKCVWDFWRARGGALGAVSGYQTLGCLPFSVFAFSTNVERISMAGSGPVDESSNLSRATNAHAVMYDFGFTSC